jgi:hypothetical protein
VARLLAISRLSGIIQGILTVRFDNTVSIAAVLYVSRMVLCTSGNCAPTPRVKFTS